MKGIAALSSGDFLVKFIGMIGRDDMGEQYAEQLSRQGVEALFALAPSDAPTATCLCMVGACTQAPRRSDRCSHCAVLPP